MPETLLNLETAIICDVCRDPSHPQSVFETVTPEAPKKKVCFQCLVVRALEETKCNFCRQEDAVAFVAFTHQGRIRPIAVGADCITELRPEDATTTLTGEDRTVIPDVGESSQ
jgi:hypothetical protein